MEGRKKKKRDVLFFVLQRFDGKHLSEWTDSVDINTTGQIRFVFTFGLFLPL